MKIGTTNTEAINAAKRFPGKLEEIHQGRIVLRECAVYINSITPIDVRCTVCGHKWKSTVSTLIHKRLGCPECKRLRNKQRAGVMRFNRASNAEKEFAKCCRKAGMYYESIAELLKRSSQTIRRWCDPVQDQKHRERSLKQSAIKKASGRLKELNAAYKQTEHGKALDTKSAHKRRSLQYHAKDVVLIDGVWHEYDCYQYIDTPEDREFWSFAGANEDVAKRKIQQDKLAAISGEPYSLEHLVPLSRGGIHHPDNFANRALALNIQKKNNILSKDVELFCRRLFA